jgi:CBS domain-containing protein
MTVPPFNEARVADMMRLGILSCHPDASLTEVADVMATHRVHAVVVAGVRNDPVRGEGLVWGLVSDLDLARAAASASGATIAADVARTEAISIDAATPLAEAARMMGEHATSHLIVIRDSQPVGMISALDIATALAAG